MFLTFNNSFLPNWIINNQIVIFNYCIYILALPYMVIYINLNLFNCCLILISPYYFVDFIYFPFQIPPWSYGYYSARHCDSLPGKSCASSIYSGHKVREASLICRGIALYFTLILWIILFVRLVSYSIFGYQAYHISHFHIHALQSIHLQS